jgi:cell division protein FtsN
MQVKHSMKKPTGLAFGAVTTLGIVLLVLAVARQASDLPAGLSGDLRLGNAGLSLAGLGLGGGTVATDDSTDAVDAQMLAASTLRERFLHGTPYEETIIDAPAAPSYKRGSSYQRGSNKAEVLPADGWLAAPSSSENNGDADAANLAVDKIRMQVQKNTAAPAAAAPVSTPPAPVVQTAQAVPEVSLQVGAFRQVESAMSLKNRLLPRFSDTWISRIDSGGEPLYRVRVGHFASVEETASLKAELLAHGFPSFRTTN